MSQKSFLLSILLLAAVAAGWFFTRPGAVGTTLRVREIAARGLAGEVVRSQASGTKVLVLSNPFTQRPEVAKAIDEMEKAGMAGLIDGLKGKLPLEAVAFPELKPEAVQNPAAVLTGIETTTPLSFLIAPDAFDKAIQQHPDCNLVISLIGLPGDLATCGAWKASSPVKFALLLPDFRSITDSATIVQAVKSGKLVAFVLPKPGSPDNNVPANADWQSEFDRRFVLVSAANVEQVLHGAKNLF